MSKIQFNTANSQFYNTLRLKVNNYFKENKVKTTGNFSLYLKTGILFSLLITSYIFLVFVTTSILINILLCVAIGLLFAAIGFGIMHDGCHGSYSGKKWVNDIMGNTLHLLGGSTFLWKAKHNINHHSFTNIEGMDDDIDVKPWLRIHEDQPKRWYHRFQHIYWIALYGLTYISWVWYRDFDKYFSGKIADMPYKKMTIREHIEFWAWKALYASIFIVVPVYNVGFWHALIGYGIICFVSGWTIAVIFQLAHVVQESDFPVPDSTNKIDANWVVHQINTTSNFSTKNKFLTWFCGGLNYQIEHHVFPRISHVHYPALSKVFKETCAEFGIGYNEFPSLFSAIRSHSRHLKVMGR